ncbi:hypothetical protein ALC53_10404 [Atta colombica]|uniref:Uncharacterized protein n=1 Tax=Atta colombica TaxID=520822 RepID=A0A195B422_9HYME|nr:hypothetical protein ALC53_10404 [Atta colombica]
MAARSSCLQHAEENASGINPARSVSIFSSYPVSGVASPYVAVQKHIGARHAICGLRFYSQSITFASASPSRAAKSRNHVNDSDVSPCQGRKGWRCVRSFPDYSGITKGFYFLHGGCLFMVPVSPSDRLFSGAIGKRTKEEIGSTWWVKPVSEEISFVRPKCETGPESSVRSPTRQVEVCPSVVFQHTRARTVYTCTRAHVRVHTCAYTHKNLRLTGVVRERRG